MFVIRYEIMLVTCSCVHVSAESPCNKHALCHDSTDVHRNVLVQGNRITVNPAIIIHKHLIEQTLGPVGTTMFSNGIY